MLWPSAGLQVKRDFSDIILPGQLHDRVRSLAAMAANTKLHGAPYRHMLFYGEEQGTGAKWECGLALLPTDLLPFVRQPQAG